jgi:hypothetical protein
MKNAKMRVFRALSISIAAGFSACNPITSMAQDGPTYNASPGLTYVDLVELSESARVIARVEIRDQATVEPERSPGLQPGFVRLYIEARTEALLAGPGAIGQDLRYLIDVPVGADGKPPKLKKLRRLLFANDVPGRPGDLQLVLPGAQFETDATLEGRVLQVMRDLADSAAPPKIDGIRDAMSVQGNLAGESETQVFLDTEDGGIVSLTILHRPGMAIDWGVAWAEIVDQAADPPARETLEWYRLACALPSNLPQQGILTRDTAARTRAMTDYRFVIEQLGGCDRSLFWPNR